MGSADLLSLGPRDRTHENVSKLLEERFSLDFRKHFFTKRMIKHWSELPRGVIGVPCQSVFKAFGQCP